MGCARNPCYHTLSRRMGNRRGLLRNCRQLWRDPRGSIQQILLGRHLNIARLDSLDVLNTLLVCLSPILGKWPQIMRNSNGWQFKQSSCNDSLV